MQASVLVCVRIPGSGLPPHDLITADLVDERGARGATTLRPRGQDPRLRSGSGWREPLVRIGAASGNQTPDLHHGDLVVHRRHGNRVRDVDRDWPDRAARGAAADGIRIPTSAPQAPRADAICERMIGN